jgi:hypothetical protein
MLYFIKFSSILQTVCHEQLSISQNVSIRIEEWNTPERATISTDPCRLLDQTICEVFLLLIPDMIFPSELSVRGYAHPDFNSQACRLIS